MTQKKSNVEPPKVEKSKVEKNASEIIAERKAKLEKSSSKASASISGKATVPNTAHDTTKDTDKNKQQEKPHERNWALRVLLILIVFLLGAGTTLYFLPILKERLPILAQWVGPDNTANSTANNSQYSEFTTKLSRLESRLAQHENDIDNLRNAAVDADPNAPNALLMERLDSLEQAALQTKEDNSKSAQDLSQSARIDMLLSRMSQLEASFVPLSKGLSDAQTARLERSQLAENSTQQSDQLDQIENRLRKVEDYAGRDNNGALLAFRLGELRRKVTSGRDFSPEIDRITDMMAQGTFAANVEIQQALGWLSQHKDGIATRNTLRDQFDDLIPSLITAGSSEADAPWWTRAYNSTKSLIMVRKTDRSANEAGDSQNMAEDMDSVIARAHQMLARFDLKSSLSLLKQLPQNIQETLDIWIMQAEIYLRAGDELDQIESLIAAYYLESQSPENKDNGSKNRETAL